jgi:peptidyl-prolyl cis-trans isomerase C
MFYGAKLMFGAFFLGNYMKKFGLYFFMITVLQTGNVLAAGEDSIVFKGGDVTVKYGDMERYIAENIPEDPKEKAAVLSRPKIYRDMAEMLYTMQVLAAEAESMPGFDREQAEWNAHIMYQRRIIKDYRAEYIKQKLKDVNWDAAAKEAYQVQKQKYLSNETVKASHILIKVDDKHDDAAAQALARDVRERALKGEDFGALAKQYSEDSSAARGGNLGTFRRGQMVKPFEDAVFALQKPGTISEVIRTPFGYHVIRLDEHKMPEQLPFAAVKDKIIKELQTQMGDKLWQDKLIAIRSSKDIVVDDKLLQELQDQYQIKQPK